MGEDAVVWIAYPIEEQIRITSMYSLFERHFESGYNFQGESHNFWECLYVVKGEVCVSGDGHVYNLSDGSIIFHKPMEFHKFSVSREEGADLLIFSFAAEGPLTSFLKNKVFVLSGYQKQILRNLCFYMENTAGNGTIQAGEEHQYLSPFSKLPTYAQTVSTYLQQLMLSLAERGVPSVASQAPDAVCFGKAISYLNCNIHRQPTIPEIARFCSISEAGLKRIFDKYAGIGVHKYLIKMKMKAASELLKDGESVSGVAARLGFSDQSYFSRAYKRETGSMPSSVKS
ncbi:MAG: AraC family transcriptional regulator [Fusicatenibacter sp.]|nr:AraC family transcriptional regulator [Lachnospiraceae bacterium]MDY2936912.1 AraC family transcriptional regulator [Fusicatenibacter sp.]